MRYEEGDGPPGHRQWKQARGQGLRMRLLSLEVSGARTLGKQVSHAWSHTVLATALWWWWFPFGRKLRRNRAGSRTWASLIPNTAIFFSRTLFCFNLLWGPSLQIDYYHVEGIWDGVSASVLILQTDPS